MSPKQTRITPKFTNFQPRGRRRTPEHSRKITDPAVVWRGEDGTLYRMEDMTSTHIVSVLTLMERVVKKHHEKFGADAQHQHLSDRIFQFMTELAKRGVPYSDVPR